MNTQDVIIIGGSQAGLCMSYYLAQKGLSHTILERGEPGQRWRHERWESLRLLTPNWQNALPGYVPRSSEPHGYMSAREFAAQLEDYARHIQAPLRCGEDVVRVSPPRSGSTEFLVETNKASYRGRAVVVATGQCAQAYIPALSRNLPPAIQQIHTKNYRTADDLPTGGVLVVGSSASGLQLAEEIHASGRPVTLAVGAHTRMPRTYRGQDIMTWLELAGILGDCATDVSNIGRKRHNPSLQLIGSDERRDINLELLAEQGVHVAGSLRAVSKDTVADFEDDFEDNVNESEARLRRVLSRIDDFIETKGLLTPSEPLPPLRLPAPVRKLNLRQANINTVLWATGYRAELGFLPDVAVNARGDARHAEGLSPISGLYFLGMNFLRHRNSSAIFGVGRDAAELCLTVEEWINQGASHAA